MSRLREDMKVIPGTAWAIAICCYLGFVALAWLVMIPRDPKLSTWPLWGAAIFALVIPIFGAIFILLVGYVNGDARRRGMRYIMWTLLAIFIPNAIGIILYFLLRDPLLRDCPSCGTSVSQEFAFCSKCGTALAHACPECRSAVQPEWSHCTKCGKSLQGA